MGRWVGLPAAGAKIPVADGGRHCVLVPRLTVASRQSSRVKRRAARPASAAVNGDTATRWSSAYSDQQWIYVDLAGDHTVTGVTLTWERAYARMYQMYAWQRAAQWGYSLWEFAVTGAWRSHPSAVLSRYSDRCPLLLAGQRASRSPKGLVRPRASPRGRRRQAAPPRCACPRRRGRPCTP